MSSWGNGVAAVERRRVPPSSKEKMEARGKVSDNIYYRNFDFFPQNNKREYFVKR
jgi:hypothetical protein